MNHDEYVKLAEVEDHMWYFRSLHRHVVRALARALPAAAPVRVLDAGCGTGGLSLRLHACRPQWQLDAFDFSPVAVQFARQRCGAALDIRQASITSLPYPNDTFDAVAAIDVLSQIELAETKVALREIFRVLRPGGAIVFNGPAYPWLYSYHDVSVQTKHRFTRGEVAALLAEAGFDRAWTTHWNSLLFPLIFARRKIFHFNHGTSDVKAYSPPIEAMFNGVMALEHAWIGLGGGWAWGTSVFATARKPPSS